MRLKTLNMIMWIACIVMVGILTSSVVASSFCNCKGKSPTSVPVQEERAQAARPQFEQLRKIYIHTNSLVYHIQERNRGKAFEQWSPGDQAMYTARSQELVELIAIHPRLARDPEATTIIHYQVTLDRE